jgi:hypothetical protein
MSRATVIIRNDRDREQIAHWAHKAPLWTRVEFKQAKRTVDQNARMWAMLTDVAQQHKHHGIYLSAADWRLIFMEGLKREMRIVPNLDGTGFVNLGRSTSDLSKAEMSDLMELIEAFGAQNGVTFHSKSEPVAA